MKTLTALSLRTSNGFLIEDIVAFCQTYEIKYHLSYDTVPTPEEWVISFGNTTDLEIVRFRHFVDTVTEANATATIHWLNAFRKKANDTF